MNSWKQYPNLFVGKFKVVIPSYHVRTYEIDAYYNNRFGVITLLGLKYFHIDDCTLIARKIDDMSDEELYGAVKAYSDVKCEFDWIKKRRGEYLIYLTEDDAFFDRDLFLYLLSIGVYPFLQSHFDTSKVIDIKTL